MSNVSPDLAKLEALSPSELEVAIQSYRSKDPSKLSDEEVAYVVALHAIARRRTAGPPARKTATPQNTDDLAAAFGVS